MFSKTVTLYNLHNDIWYPTVLHGCSLVIDKSARQVQTGIEGEDRATLHIPKSSIDAAGVEVIGPKAYKALSTPTGYITFCEGTDFFAEGEEDVNYVEDEGYPSGYFDSLNRRRDGVYRITSASSEYSLIPHYEITGK